MEYVRVKEGEDIYIVAKTLVKQVFKQKYNVLSQHRGTELAGLSYSPVFNFVEVEKGHQVVTADFVTEHNGTGIVHIAPAYGEDDYKVMEENSFSFVNVVDGKGQYTSHVPRFCHPVRRDAGSNPIPIIMEYIPITVAFRSFGAPFY
jgi:isoleucyl-tRNA synthetase